MCSLQALPGGCQKLPGLLDPHCDGLPTERNIDIIITPDPIIKGIQ